MTTNPELSKDSPKPDLRTLLSRGILLGGFGSLVYLVLLARWFNSHEQDVLASHGNWRYNDRAYHRLDLNLRHLRFGALAYLLSLLSFFVPLSCAFAGMAVSRKEPISREAVLSFVLLFAALICWMIFGGTITDLSDFLE